MPATNRTSLGSTNPGNRQSQAQNRSTKARRGAPSAKKSNWKKDASWFLNTPESPTTGLPKNRRQMKSCLSGPENYANGE